MTLDLPSLRFTTDFDTPETHAELPVTVGSGRHEALLVVDNVQRRSERLGRCEGSPALVGLKISPDPRPLRVTVELFADRTTAGMWSKFGPSGDARGHFGPRLIIIRSQGATRAAAMVARGDGQFEFNARTKITFDLPGSSVAVDGLLIVELAEATLPDWAAGRLAPTPAIGLGIERISVRPVEGDMAPVTVDVPTGDAATLGGGLIPIGPGTLAGDRTSWRLRVGPLGAVGADPPPPDRSGPFPVRAPGAPALTNRDKMRQLVRRKLEDIEQTVRLSALHTVVRVGRVAAYPLAGGAVGGVLSAELRSRRLAASLVALGSAKVPEVTVVRQGYRTIQVNVPYRLTEPALLALRAGEGDAGRLTWRLIREPDPRQNGSVR